MDLIECIVAESKNTVAYKESQDRLSFTYGVRIGAVQAEAFYKLEVDNLNLRLKISEETAAKYLNDLKTMSSIVERYSNS